MMKNKGSGRVIKSEKFEEDLKRKKERKRERKKTMIYYSNCSQLRDRSAAGVDAWSIKRSSVSSAFIDRGSLEDSALPLASSWSPSDWPGVLLIIDDGGCCCCWFWLADDWRRAIACNPSCNGCRQRRGAAAVTDAGDDNECVALFSVGLLLLGTWSVTKGGDSMILAQSPSWRLAVKSKAADGLLVTGSIGCTWIVATEDAPEVAVGTTDGLILPTGPPFFLNIN